MSYQSAEAAQNPHPDIHPDIQLPDGSESTCVLSEHCSKVTCTSPEGDTSPFGHMVLTVQVNGCQKPLKATVSLESSGETWSHVFEDGGKAAMPTPPGIPNNRKPFMMVNLKENGGKVHFKVGKTFIVS